jgi:hypothetical protein
MHLVKRRPGYPFDPPPWTDGRAIRGQRPARPRSLQLRIGRGPLAHESQSRKNALVVTAPVEDRDGRFLRGLPLSASAAAC